MGRKTAVPRLAEKLALMNHKLDYIFEARELLMKFKSMIESGVEVEFEKDEEEGYKEVPTMQVICLFMAKYI